MAASILWAPGKSALFLQEKPMSIKFLVLGGGGGILGLGGGAADFIFYGRGDFSDKWGFGEGHLKGKFAPFSRLIKILYLREENCLQTAHFYKQKGPCLKRPLNSTGSAFPLLILIGQRRVHLQCAWGAQGNQHYNTIF